jgi:hypothetical protein
MARKNSQNKLIDLEFDKELVEKHARMRARDRERIEKGEATPEEIQAENSIFPKFKTVYFPKLTI